MRKITGIAMIVLIISMGMVFAQGSKDAAAKKPEVKELTLWHYFTGTDGSVFEEVVAAYNRDHPEVHINSQFVPREELMKQYTIGLVGKNLPDIGMVDNPDHASFSSMGLFLDISSYVSDWQDKDAFFPGPWKSCEYEGGLYGIPHNSNCLALWYNIDMFNEAGITKVPETWDELYDAAARLTKNGVYGLAISAPKNEEGTFQYLPWLLSSNGSIDELDSPESIKSMAFLTKLVQNGYMSSEVINWTQADVEKQFATERAAMMINGPWNIGTVRNDNPDLKWDLAKIPRDKTFASVLGGENFGIMADATYPDEAWDFIAYISQKDVMTDFCLRGGKFPPRKDAMNENAFWTDDPILSVFTEQMQYAMPRGPHPSWPEISLAISTAMQESFTGAKTPAAAMKDAQAAIAPIL
jgi:multiple sugar transport system substrate-binding protein